MIIGYTYFVYNVTRDQWACKTPLDTPYWSDVLQNGITIIYEDVDGDETYDRIQLQHLSNFLFGIDLNKGDKLIAVGELRGDSPDFSDVIPIDSYELYLKLNKIYLGYNG